MKIQILRSLTKNQSGIASMVIVMIIMTILTLIVLSMTQNANREQRQSLDRQLNSQAFYAAESGVHDAKDYIAQNPDSAPNEKDKCDHTQTGADPGDQFPGKPARVSDTDEAIRYSCVLYDRDPKTIEISDLDVNDTEIFPIEHSTPGADSDIAELTFSWTKKGGGTNFAGCPNPDLLLPEQLSADCEAGMLRVALINARADSRQKLIDSSFAAYLKPSKKPNPTPSLDYGSASGTLSKQGAIVAASCSVDACTVKITNILEKKLYLQLRSIYKTNHVVINGKTQGGEEVQFNRAQVEIDSTGLANDILKRISVRVPLSGIETGGIPGNVLQTTNSLCKRFQIKQGTITDECPAVP